jgi:hypothetical protein
MFDKNKELYRQEHILQLFYFAVVDGDLKYILTETLQILENVVVETFLLNRICYNLLYFIQER